MRARESLPTSDPWLWPRPRVLIEDPDESRAAARAAAVRLHGMAVAVCPGPGHGDHCPLAGDEDCITAREADVVVSSLGVEEVEMREVVTALRTRAPRVPVLLAADAASTERWPELVAGCELVEADISPDALAARVAAVAAGEGLHGT